MKNPTKKIQKKKKKLHKLKLEIAQHKDSLLYYEHLFAADGNIDKKEQKLLNRLLRIIEKIEGKIDKKENEIEQLEQKVEEASSIHFREDIISEKAEKIDEHIQKEIEKAIEEGRSIDVLEAQNRIAEKMQNKKWYRGGKTKKDGTADYKSNTIGREVETKMVWKLYDQLPNTNLFESGDRSKMGMNKDYVLKLDKKNRDYEYVFVMRRN